MKKRITILSIIIVGISIGFLAYFYVAIKIELKNQSGNIIFPPELDVIARATNDVDIGLHGRINAQVPFKQTVNIPLKGKYSANIKMTAKIPLNLTLNYQSTVPIKTEVDINAKTDLVFENRLLSNFPLSFTLPIEFEQPVNLEIPVSTMIELAYAGPIGLTFFQHLDVPINTVLKTHLDVSRKVSTPISSTFGMRLQAPNEAQKLIIHDADLRIPLNQLHLYKNEK